MECTQKDLAMILGLTTRRVRELTSDGLFSKIPDSRRYNVRACVQAYIAYKVDQLTGGSAGLDYERVRAQHEQVKKQIAELRLRRLKAELHLGSDVEAVISDMLVRFRSKTLAVPAKVAPRLIGVKDATQMAHILASELRETLLELSEYSPEAYSGGEADDAEEDSESD